MKKISKLLTLSLVTLTMMSCSRNTVSSTAPEDSTSSSQNESSQTPSSSSPLTSSTSSISSETEPSSTTSSSTPTSSSTDIYDTPWGNTIVDKMVKYLGGNILPYINLGKGIGCEWNAKSGNYGGLEFDEIDEYTSALVESFKTAYQQAGYVISSISNGYAAKNEQLGITVNLTKKTGGTAFFVAYYDEPYDESKASDWSQNIKDDIKSYLDNHAIPFVYLGTDHPTAFYTANSYKLSIYGGKWDDRIMTKAETAFTKAGYTFTESTDKSSLVSTIDVADGCKMQISIYNNKSTTAPKAFYDIVFTQAYNPDAITDWDDDTKFEMKEDLDKHYLPVIYLGLKTCTTTFSTSSNTLTIKGGIFNPLMIENGKKAFEDDEWTIDKSDDSSVTVTKNFDDGCRIHATLKNNNGTAVITARLVEKFTVPTEQTDWDDNAKAVIAQNLDNHNLPFFYMGLDEVKTSWSGTSRYLTITGDYFNEHMIDNAKTAFEANDWQVTLGENTYGLTFTATKTETDGDALKATMNAVSTSGKASLKVEIDEAYNAPTEESEKAWDADTVTYMKTNFHNFVLPYVYLGTKNVYKTYNSSNASLTISGGAWNDAIFTDFVAALNAEAETRTWEIKDETSSTYGAMKVATYKNSTSNYAVTLTLYKNASNHPVLEGVYQDVFEIPENGAWEETTAKTMKQYLNNETLPYIYLGSNSPKCTTSTRKNMTNTVKLTGGKWNNQVPGIAEAALKAAGYTVMKEKKNNAISVQAIKIFDDKSQIRVVVYRSSATGLNTTAMLEAYFDAAPNISASTDWDSATKTNLETFLGAEHTVPFIDLGDGATVTMTQADNTKTPSGYRYQYYKFVYASGYTSANITQAQAVFESNGFTVEHQYGYQSFSERIIASKTFEDGFTTRVSLYGVTNQINMYVTKYNKFDPASKTSWSDTTTTLMKKYFDGNVLPYVYLGTDTETATWDSSNKIIKIGGEAWNDSIYDNVKTSLESNKKYTWSYSYEYTTYNQKKLIASGVNSETGDMFRVTTYNYGGKWNIYAVDKPYMEISFTQGFVSDGEQQWDTNVLSYMNDNLNGNIIPFFYLGSKITCSSSSLATLTLTSDGWSDEILTNCEAALKADTNNTWTVTYNLAGKYGKTLNAYCDTKEGGHISLSLYHYNYVSSSSSGSYTYNQAKVEINYAF